MTRSRHLAVLSLCVAGIAVLTGISAALLTILFLAVEKLSFGADESSAPIPTDVTSPGRILTVYIASGVVGSIAWWSLQRWGRPQPSVPRSLDGYHSVIPETSANVALQVAQVGTGASVGRENAPRVAGALWADRVAAWARMSPELRRLLIASAAGAGLAAAYRVPLAGIAFAIELCGVSIRLSKVIVVSATCLIATAISALIEPTGLQYSAPHVACSWTTLLVAILMGVIIGPLGGAFRRLARWCQRWATHDARVLYRMPVGFALVGIAAMSFPALAGNGKYAAVSVFDASMGWKALVLLCVLNVVVTLISLASGALGGILTPSFSIGVMAGGLAGIALSGAMSTVGNAITTADVLTESVNGTPILACAVLGGAAFLATAQRAPLFALLITAEFTGQGLSSIPAIAVAVIVASLPLIYPTLSKKCRGAGTFSFLTRQ
ncbi:chloride channel protein [Corynebacterium sp. SFY-M4]|nr:chloride channel protein [Corynebacterium sp. SFY-M4]